VLGDEPAAFAGRRELLLGNQVGTLRELGAGTAAFLARLGAEARWGPPAAGGFAHLGQVVDPEDGPVWRWERAPGPSPS